MIKELSKSIREYKKPSILSPVFVSLEVVMECIIPFVIARLVNEIKAGLRFENDCGLWRDFNFDGRFGFVYRGGSRFCRCYRFMWLCKKSEKRYVL